MRTSPWLLVAMSLAACGDDGSPPGVDASGEDAAVDAGVDGSVEPPDAALPPARPAEPPLRRYVDPFVGTGGVGFGVGSASLAPQTPFGLARPGPDTATAGGAPGFNHCAGYYYEDTFIRGFSQVRPHGMGIPEYGVIGLMPTDGMSADKTTMDGHRSAFDHATESAEPGYYAVTLADTNIAVELTASDRVGHLRATFPEDGDRTLLVDVGHFIGELTILGGEVEVDPAAREVSGFSWFSGGYSGRFGGMPVYFVARFDQSFAGYGVWDDGALFPGEARRTGSAVGAWVDFDEAQVHVQVGLSMTDLAHARMNLDAEAAEFDAVRAATADRWEEALSRVAIEARSERDMRLFYTALYHALLMPTLASDVDGSYRGLDGEVHRAEGFRYFTDFSLWDTYRTQVPLLTLLYPELLREQLLSLMAMMRDGGYAPRWPLGIGYTGGMVGDSADLVFADAWAKGVRDFDVAEAYAGLRRTAFHPTGPPYGPPTRFGGRSGIERYLELGYVPLEAAGASASRTLEYAYDDWGLAALAEAAGATEDAASLRRRAGNWSHLWDDERQMLLGRSEDGSFPTDVNTEAWSDFYAEGNVWQYLWFVPHDLGGLADRMGGPDAMVTRLVELFERSTRRTSTVLPGQYYWHGNEPDIHYAWIPSFFDRPEPSARWVRWIVRAFYDDTPAGLPGNDDSGTLSSWLVFAQLGLYPITGWDQYLLATPMLPRAVLHLPGGDLVIEAPEASDEAYRHVGPVLLDGAPLPGARVPHARLAGGATLRFDVAR